METERLILREPADGDVEALRDYYRRNAARFAPFEPVVPDTQADQLAWIVARHAERVGGRATSFLAFDRGTSQTAGIVMMNGFSSEGGLSAMLSYSVDGAFEGQGYATEAVRRVIEYAAAELGVGSLTAYYAPSNVRSGHLLERLGFTIVGQTPVIPGFEKLMRPNMIAVIATMPEPKT
jgi:ribosomal-protein-alanine N-acetyltransferase